MENICEKRDFQTLKMNFQFLCVKHKRKKKETIYTKQKEVKYKSGESCHMQISKIPIQIHDVHISYVKYVGYSIPLLFFFRDFLTM